MSAKRKQRDQYWVRVWTEEDQIRQEILERERREMQEAREAGEVYIPSFELENLYYRYF